MAHLTIDQPGVPTITTHLLRKVTSLGRAEDNDVMLVADEVSRHHAKLCKRGDKIVLIDLNSLNGTYVNRQQVIERVLVDKDEIWLGSKCRVILHLDAKADAEQKDAPPDSESVLVENLERIREDMDRVGNDMTMIVKQAKAEEKPAGRLSGASQEELVAMGRAYRRISALYQTSNQVSRLIASNADLATRLAAVLDAAIQVTEADRGFVMLRDEESGGLRVDVAREMGHDLSASSPSMGIAGRAANYGEPVLMRDREMDDQFGGRESIIAQQICSAMCVPLKLEDRIFGSIYVDTRRAGQSFDEEDLELFASMAAQSALAIENVQLSEQMIESEKKRANLGRFLSPAIVEEIMKEDTVLELGGRKQLVTTMFCDIRSFTPIAERLNPTVLVGMLNEYFTAMVSIVFENEGTLDKYIGDEIMAVFGAPLSQPDDAGRAVKAALAMQRENAELNLTRKQAGLPPFDIGIGINSGEVIAGYVGAPERMEFTVIGDEVNVARRLCSMASPGQVVAGVSTYEHVKDWVKAREIGTVVLEGKEVPVRAYEIYGLRLNAGDVPTKPGPSS